MHKHIVIGVVVGVLLSSAAIVLAGSLDPPSGPMDAASQMYTLEQIYDRLDTGAVSCPGRKFSSVKQPEEMMVSDTHATGSRDVDHPVQGKR